MQYQENLSVLYWADYVLSGPNFSKLNEGVTSSLKGFVKK